MAISPIAAAKRASGTLGRRFSALSRRAKTFLIGGGIVLILVLLVLLHGHGASATDNTVPTVTLQSVGSFGDGSGGVAVVGTVQSVSQADLLAQSGGTVTAVRAKLGSSVPAGYVIAELDSAAASAAVLQARGAYDAAVAAERATGLQAQNSTGSLFEQQVSVRTLYQTDYTATQNTLTNDVGVFFGDNTPVGPQLLIEPGTSGDQLPRERRALDQVMVSWQQSLASANTTDPLTLLSNAQNYLSQINSFLSDLSTVAREQNSGASATQLADLAATQSTINGLLSGISSARLAYNTAVTAAAVGQTQSGSGADVSSSEAVVEQALGGLRAAQAAYEKTVIRAPIAGTINYLNIHVGDNVTPNQRVATVARNNALEVILQLSQADAERVAVGDTVSISGGYHGTITAIAPALDPVTKQIEVDIAVSEAASLVNGQSVQVTLPALASETPTPAAADAVGIASAASTASSTSASLLLPLTAVKLLPSERDVFTVDTSGHLVPHIVSIGQVIGDRIQVTTPLPANLEIVVDARGLSAGDAVRVATSTPAS